jgi:hypothetical protein
VAAGLLSGSGGHCSSDCAGDRHSNRLLRGGEGFSGDVIALLKTRYRRDWEAYEQIVHSRGGHDVGDINSPVGDNHNAIIKSDISTLLNAVHSITATNDTLSDKITALVHDRYAPMFIEGFITRREGGGDDPLLSKVLKGWKDEYLFASDRELYASDTSGMQIEEEARACHALSNRIAILQIKLCDYLEDVFLYVATNEVQREEEEEVQRGGYNEGGKKGLAEVRVISLLIIICVVSIVICVALFLSLCPAASRGAASVPVPGPLGPPDCVDK